MKKSEVKEPVEKRYQSKSPVGSLRKDGDSDSDSDVEVDRDPEPDSDSSRSEKSVRRPPSKMLPERVRGPLAGGSSFAGAAARVPPFPPPVFMWCPTIGLPPWCPTLFPPGYVQVIFE